MRDISVIYVGKAKLRIITDDNTLVGCNFVGKETLITEGIGYSKEVGSQIKEYLCGQRVAFDVNLLDVLGNDTEDDIYRALLQVPYGTTVSYGELARLSGHEGYARGVGSAMKANPIMIIVPCHRVIKQSGEYGEYVGGTELKERLISLEKAVRRTRSTP